MFQNDYLLRMIQQITEALATQIFQLKKEKKHDEALAAIGELLNRHSLPSLKMVHTLTLDQLLRLLSTNGQLAAAKVQTVAMLLTEEADILSARGGSDAYVASALKSLKLYLVLFQESLENGDKHNLTEASRPIEPLLDMLSPFELPPDLKLELMAYYEHTGQFSKAEDLLFELLDEGQADIELGTLFYERLLKKDDRELITGNLPRNEIYDGIAELQRFTRKASRSMEYT